MELMLSLFMRSRRSLAWSHQSEWLDQKSEWASCFVPPESGFFMGKRIQESLGPLGKACSLKERAIQRHN